MNILIVEDNPNRIAYFKENISDEHNVVYAETASEGIEAFDSQSFDLIMLDHDLGGREYVPSNDSNTGYQVAKHIGKKGTNAQILIHSLNGQGRNNIQKVLADKDIISHQTPFLGATFMQIMPQLAKKINNFA